MTPDEIEQVPDAIAAPAEPVVEAAVPAPKPRSKSAGSAAAPALLGTGRRREAIARVRLIAGTGHISINKTPFDQYFPRETLRLNVKQPLIVTHQLGKYDVIVNAQGGGLAGQAGAIRLGLARALLQLDPALKASLRAAGLLTRDPRMKERKKYGQKGARKRFQWTKR